MCLLDTSTYHYKSRRPGRFASRACATAIGGFTSSCGVRLGATVRTRRGDELGLQLRNKTPKRRVKAKLREDRRPATRSTETWAMDFVHAQLATGWPRTAHPLAGSSRVPTIVNTFSLRTLFAICR